uniref:RdRp n=1 Tax=Hubei virga-like viurs 8 TaxID=1923341 RepID=A0A1L3KK44_9VIRU|nr:RdRp [Hubei virga-like viurs 8]
MEIRHTTMETSNSSSCLSDSTSEISENSVRSLSFDVSATSQARVVEYLSRLTDPVNPNDTIAGLVKAELRKSDSSLRNSINDVLIGGVNNILVNQSKLKKIKINDTLTNDQITALATVFPKFDLDTSQPKEYGAHAYARVSRKLEILDLLDSFNIVANIKVQKIYTHALIDVGGSPMFYINSELDNVHCCCPALSQNDVRRHAQTDVFVRANYIPTVSGKDSIKQKLISQYLSTSSKFVCRNLSQNCYQYTAPYCMFVHSTYDMTLFDIGDIMDSHKADCGRGTFMFKPEFLLLSSGRDATLELRWRHVTRSSVRYIRFSFDGDEQLGYEHRLDTYTALLSAPLLYSTDYRNVFSISLDKNLNGIQFFSLYRIREGKIPRSFEFRDISISSHRDKVLVRSWEYTYPNDRDVNCIVTSNSLRPIRIIVPKHLYSNLYAYIMSLPDGRFTIANCNVVANAFNRRYVVGGASIMSPEKIDEEDLYRLVTALYFICYIKRYVQTKTLSSLLQDENKARESTSEVSKLFNAISSWFSGGKFDVPLVDPDFASLANGITLESDPAKAERDRGTCLSKYRAFILKYSSGRKYPVSASALFDYIEINYETKAICKTVHKLNDFQYFFQPSYVRGAINTDKAEDENFLPQSETIDSEGVTPESIISQPQNTYCFRKGIVPNKEEAVIRYSPYCMESNISLTLINSPGAGYCGYHSLQHAMGLDVETKQFIEILKINVKSPQLKKTLTFDTSSATIEVEHWVNEFVIAYVAQLFSINICVHADDHHQHFFNPQYTSTIHIQHVTNHFNYYKKLLSMTYIMPPAPLYLTTFLEVDYVPRYNNHWQEYDDYYAKFNALPEHLKSSAYSRYHQLSSLRITDKDSVSRNFYHFAELNKRISFIPGPQGNVLDMGAAPGAFSAYILKNFPGLNVYVPIYDRVKLHPVVSTYNNAIILELESGGDLLARGAALDLFNSVNNNKMSLTICGAFDSRNQETSGHLLGNQVAISIACLAKDGNMVVHCHRLNEYSKIVLSFAATLFNQVIALRPYTMLPHSPTCYYVFTGFLADRAPPGIADILTEIFSQNFKFNINNFFTQADNLVSGLALDGVKLLLDSTKSGNQKINHSYSSGKLNDLKLYINPRISAVGGGGLKPELRRNYFYTIKDYIVSSFTSYVKSTPIVTNLVDGLPEDQDTKSVALSVIDEQTELDTDIDVSVSVSLPSLADSYRPLSVPIDFPDDGHDSTLTIDDVLQWEPYAGIISPPSGFTDSSTENLDYSTAEEVLAATYASSNRLCPSTIAEPYSPPPEYDGDTDPPELRQHLLSILEPIEEYKPASVIITAPNTDCMVKTIHRQCFVDTKTAVGIQLNTPHVYHPSATDTVPYDDIEESVEAFDHFSIEKTAKVSFALEPLKIKTYTEFQSPYQETSPKKVHFRLDGLEKLLVKFNYSDTKINSIIYSLDIRFKPVILFVPNSLDFAQTDAGQVEWSLVQGTLQIVFPDGDFYFYLRRFFAYLKSKGNFSISLDDGSISLFNLEPYKFRDTLAVLTVEFHQNVNIVVNDRNSMPQEPKAKCTITDPPILTKEPDNDFDSIARNSAREFLNYCLASHNKQLATYRSIYNTYGGDRSSYSVAELQALKNDGEHFVFVYGSGRIRAGELPSDGLTKFKFAFNGRDFIPNENLLKEHLYLYGDYTSALFEFQYYKNLSILDITTFVLPKSIQFVQAIPGAGKTTYIVKSVCDNLNSSSVPTDLVLCSTREGKLDVADRIKARHNSLDSRVKYSELVKTMGSYLLNKTSKVENLLVDEAMMHHCGAIVFAAHISQCRTLIMVGDQNQIPFVSRLGTMNLTHYRADKLTSNIETMSNSYRIPADVACHLSAFYRQELRTHNQIKRSIVVAKITGINGVPKRRDVTYLVFTQPEKRQLSTLFAGVKVFTVHEFQGKESEHIILVRLNTVKSHVLFTQAPYQIVAISRHTRTFHYFTVLEDSLYTLLSKTIIPDRLNKAVVKTAGYLYNEHVNHPFAGLMTLDLPKSSKDFTIQYCTGSVYTSNVSMFIVHAVSRDGAVRAGFAKSVRADHKAYRNNRRPFKFSDNSRVNVTYGTKRKYIHLVTKEKCYQRPKYRIVRAALVELRGFLMASEITRVAMPRICCGLDTLEWKRISKILLDVFQYTGIKLFVYNSHSSVNLDLLEAVCSLFDTNAIDDRKNMSVTPRHLGDYHAIRPYYVESVAPYVDSCELLQIAHDSCLPGTSYNYLETDQWQVHNNDIDLPFSNMVIRGFGGQFKLPTFDCLRPMVNTAMPDIRPYTRDESILAARKRNDDVPKYDRVVDEDEMAHDMWDKCKESFFNSDLVAYFRSNEITHSIDDTLEWLKTQTPLRPENFTSEFSLLESDLLTYNFSIKRNPKPNLTVDSHLLYSALQTIVYHPKHINTIFCPIFRELKRRILASLNKNIFLFTDEDPSSFVNRISEYCAGVNPYNFSPLEADISKYDKSQGSLALLYECLWMLDFGCPDFIVKLWFLMHRCTKLKDFSSKFAFYVMYQRKSGDASTFLGNSMFLLGVLSYLFVADNIYLLLFAGDDSLILSYNTVEDTSILANILFNLEVKYFYFKSFYFCSKFLIWDEGRFSFVPDPVKLLVKLGRRDIRNFQHLEEYRVSHVDLLKIYDDYRVCSLIGPAIQERYPTCVLNFSVVLPSIYYCFKSIDNLKKLFYSLPGDNLLRDPSFPTLD